MVLYCAMLGDNPPGILIVTPLKIQATEIATQINELAGEHRAVAHHTDTPASSHTMNNSPVLVVTHSAYENRIRSTTEIGFGLANPLRLTEWSGGPRRLTIIDETPAAVCFHRISLQDVGQMHGALRSVLGAEQQDQLLRVEGFYHALRAARETNENRERFLVESELSCLNAIDFVGMHSAVAAIDADEMQFGRKDGIEGARIRTQCRATLRGLANIQRLGWAWISQRRGVLLIHVSEPALPGEHPGGVILDATACINRIYDVLGERVVVTAAEPNLRNYANVTLRVAANHVVGKESLTKNIGTVWPKVSLELAKLLPQESRILVCCHKAVEPFIKSYDAGFSNLAVTHWGKISGLNDWSDYDTVVILGLPYLNPVVAAEMYMALQGQTNDDWLQSSQFRAFGNHTDIREAIDNSHIAMSVIQAVNRVQCRRTIDKAGNCARTNIFMLLPNGRVGESIMSAIENEMHGIYMQPWKIDLQTQKKRPAPGRDAIVAYFASVGSGIYPKPCIIAQQGISKSSLDRFIKSLKEDDSVNAATLRELGVEYISKKGRGVKSQFVKNVETSPSEVEPVKEPVGTAQEMSEVELIELLMKASSMPLPAAIHSSPIRMSMSASDIEALEALGLQPT